MGYPNLKNKIHQNCSNIMLLCNISTLKVMDGNATWYLLLKASDSDLEKKIIITKKIFDIARDYNFMTCYECYEGTDDSKNSFWFKHNKLMNKSMDDILKYGYNDIMNMKIKEPKGGANNSGKDEKIACVITATERIITSISLEILLYEGE